MPRSLHDLQSLLDSPPQVGRNRKHSSSQMPHVRVHSWRTASSPRRTVNADLYSRDDVVLDVVKASVDPVTRSMRPFRTQWPMARHWLWAGRPAGRCGPREVVVPRHRTVGRRARKGPAPGIHDLRYERAVHGSVVGVCRLQRRIPGASIAGFLARHAASLLHRAMSPFSLPAALSGVREIANSKGSLFWSRVSIRLRFCTACQR